MDILNNSCDFQAFVSGIILIIGAVFTGIRYSRCETIDSPCIHCKRKILEQEENTNNV